MATQAQRFSRCVKKVSGDFKPKKLTRKKRYSEGEKKGISIAICTKSILWPQKRTLKRFYMKDGKPVLYTQSRKTQKLAQPKK